MTISFDASGDFKNTERFIGKVTKINLLPALRSLAMAGDRSKNHLYGLRATSSPY